MTTKSIDESKSDEKTYTLESICDQQLSCPCLQEFIKSMKLYNQTSVKSCDIDETKLLTVLNNYIHVLHHHQRKAINKLEMCDINQCLKFERNHNHRNAINKYNPNEHEIHMHHELMDKMHCYVYHPIDEQLKRHRTERIAKKYNIFTEIETKETYDNMYSFGYKFAYGKDDEFTGAPPRGIDVFQKYPTLKEELTNNLIFTLHMKQFKNEYKKSLLYFASFYRKSNNKWISMKAENILSLMIYCNYTHLQYYFSKTYRENEVKDHQEFYWP
eukprot:521889_1